MSDAVSRGFRVVCTFGLEILRNLTLLVYVVLLDSWIRYMDGSCIRGVFLWGEGGWVGFFGSWYHGMLPRPFGTTSKWEGVVGLRLLFVLFGGISGGVLPCLVGGAGGGA